MNTMQSTSQTVEALAPGIFLSKAGRFIHPLYPDNHSDPLRIHFLHKMPIINFHKIITLILGSGIGGQLQRRG